MVLLFLTSCVQLCFAASNPSLASASPTPSTYSLMDSSPTSTTPFLPSPSAGTSQLELGVRVSTSAPGTITAVRYYQDSQDGAQYVAHIWDSNRNLIATQAFETSTTIGWHEVQLSNPVLIAANSTFVVSVFSTAYNYTGSHFPTTTSGPLTVQAGVYAYSSSSTYPSTDSADGYNYLVDFVFDQSSTLIPCSVSGSYQVVGTHVIFDNNYNHSCTGSVTIPATITSIDNDAFSYDPGLTSVSFEPGSAITSIGREAFYDDQAITDVSLPQGLQVIGENAFG